MLLIEADPKRTVEDVAKTLHDQYTDKDRKVRAEIEAEVKAQFQKEQAGGSSIPQSPGSASTPDPTARFNKVSEEDDWAQALNASKAGLMK
jgi:hypothetical protein